MHRFQSYPQRRRRPAGRVPEPSRLILLNKPFDVLCQFTDEQGRKTLKNFVDIPGVYAAGRLDRDSEGLLLLTNDGQFQARISDPRHKMEKTYWVQVEGEPTQEAVDKLCRGVMLNDGPARAESATLIASPQLWARQPPIRFRHSIPTSWLSVTLREGRNRQVRRMTAAIGAPTLRLVRMAIGPWQLDDLQPGQWRDVTPSSLSRS